MTCFLHDYCARPASPGRVFSIGVHCTCMKIIYNVIWSIDYDISESCCVHANSAVRTTATGSLLYVIKFQPFDVLAPKFIMTFTRFIVV